MTLRVAILTALPALGLHAEMQTDWRFDVGVEASSPDHLRVGPGTPYSAASGFGWLDDRPATFGVRVPEGNYDVTIHFRDADVAAAATVKAEARRLMLRKVPGGTAPARRFTVNVRTPVLADGGRVRLGARGAGSLTWDDRLTIEFLPDAAGVMRIELVAAPDAPTLYLVGDSTVTDQGREPWASWGQMLPWFFAPGIAVANHADSGRALHSFRWEKRLDKILETLRPGDYLFIQFGHNDQKDKAEGAGPFTTFKANLQQYVAAVRGKGAQPVVVTPMERRRWTGDQPGQTLTAFAEAARQVGREEGVPVIDLHAMSLALYGALGPEGSKRAFVHYPANTFPGQREALEDNSHHSVYGAYMLARCVVAGIRAHVPGLATHLRADAGCFDPSRPDAPDSLDIPPSPLAEVRAPEGD